jgi:hypothetical protein
MAHTTSPSTTALACDEKRCSSEAASETSKPSALNDNRQHSIRSHVTIQNTHGFFGLDPKELMRPFFSLVNIAKCPRVSSVTCDERYFTDFVGMNYFLYTLIDIAKVNGWFALDRKNVICRQQCPLHLHTCPPGDLPDICCTERLSRSVVETIFIITNGMRN